MRKLLVMIVFLFVISCSSFIQGSREDRMTGRLEEEMILISAGEFIMGSNDAGKLDAISIHVKGSPQKKVFVDTFYIARYETTNIQFNQFLQAGGYSNQEYWSEEGWAFITENGFTVPKYWGEKIPRVYSTLEYPNYPVLGTSWHEASAYAKWRGKRLPTEMEWEKAARGVDGREWPWGNEYDRFRCNSLESGIRATTVVGGYKKGASPYGVMDMCGNIYEFTSDRYKDQKTVQKEFAGDADFWRGGAVILKGGSWDDKATVNKVWRRFIAPIRERERGRHNGIRLVSGVTQK